MKTLTLSLVVIVSLTISNSLQAAGPLHEFLGISESDESPALLSEFPTIFEGRPIDRFLQTLGKEIGIVKSTILETEKAAPEAEQKKVITKKRKTPAPIVKPSLFRIKLKDSEI